MPTKLPHPTTRAGDPSPARLGPYETAYDVRRGYEVPAPRVDRPATTYLRGRDAER